MQSNRRLESRDRRQSQNYECSHRKTETHTLSPGEVYPLGRGTGIESQGMKALWRKHEDRSMLGY